MHWEILLGSGGAAPATAPGPGSPRGARRTSPATGAGSSEPALGSHDPRIATRVAPQPPASAGARPAWAAALLVLASAVACAGDEPAGSPAGEPVSADSADAVAPAAGSVATPAIDSAPAAAAPAAVHEILGEGVDVSSHVGTVDWTAVRAAGHTFAFVKATEGEDLADPTFETWWPAMKEAGVVRGAYHFYVTEDDPTAQAEFFISRVDLAPGDLAPVVDVELIGQGTQPGLADRLRTFLSILEAHYGVKPIVYTAPNFWNANVGEGFGDHPLWIAEYGVDEPAVPTGWTTWHLWQHTGDAAVPGVEKSADLSRVNPSPEVDLSELVMPSRTAANDPAATDPAANAPAAAGSSGP